MRRVKMAAAHVEPAVPWASVAILALVALASCAPRQQTPPATVKPTTQPAQTPPPVRQPVSDAEYVAAAASLDHYLIRSAELALQRSTDPRIHRYAKLTLQRHHGTSAQLSFAGRRLNLLPSARMRPKHMAMLNTLVSATDFAALYKEQQRAAYLDAAMLHLTYAQTGQSPTLRPVAQAAARVVEANAQALAGL